MVVRRAMGELVNHGKYAISDPIQYLYFIFDFISKRQFLNKKPYLQDKDDMVRNLFLMRLLHIDKNTVNRIISELYSDKAFIEYVTSSLRGVGRYIGEISSPEILYVVVRKMYPDIIVETGVAAGVSSAFILKALEDNGKGVLYSIDMPNYEVELSKQGVMRYPIAILPEGKEVGFAVPEWLKQRWHLTIGKSQNVLTALLSKLGSIDIFLHDSEHTYANMYFEFSTAWQFLRKDGILISHDVSWNRAFSDFARKVKRKAIYMFGSDIGAVRKT